MWNFNNLEQYVAAVENTNFDYCDNIDDINALVARWTQQIFNLAPENIPIN